MSAQNPFHLGWFLHGSSVVSWGEPWTGNIGENWMKPDLVIDVARAVDRACLDYLLLEDSSYVGEAYQGSREIYLKNGMSTPRQDPAVIASLMLAATTHVGIVPTLSTFAYPPYLLARLVGTLDQISAGRAGWNLVTGSSDYVAQNYGHDRLPDHDTRYDIADELVTVVTGLWDSWEPEAMVVDRANGVLVDHTKVHSIDFAGKYYKCRGPLNSGPCPQGRPVIAQAGGSPRGRRFAATHADTIVANVRGVEAMKEYRDDIRSTMASVGRDPDSAKVFYLITPIVAETSEEARGRAEQRRRQAEVQIDQRLATLSKISNIDFSKFDLDAPVGQLTTNGHQRSLAEFLRKAGNRTLRDAITDFSSGGLSVELIGTPDEVAGQMAEVMQEVGGDGFLFANFNITRRTIAEITDGLVPALQQRGLARRSYQTKQLREHLQEF